MRRRVMAMCAAVLAAGCEQPRTELVVRVESELAWGPGQRVQSVMLTVRRGSAAGPLRSARTTALGTGGERLPLPLFVGVSAGDDLITPVWIEALGCGDPNGCTAATAAVAQRAVVRFSRGQTEEVPLLLASACAGVACASDRRCTTGGVCEAATRAQATVVPFSGTHAGAPVLDATADTAEVTDVFIALSEAGTATGNVVSDQGIVPMADVPADLAADVGVDAGVRDAAIDDASRADSIVALDLGAPDTGITEAGAIDSGLVDAGPSLACTALSGDRVCHGTGGLAPCCIPILTSTSCGCQMPLFGCLPCP